MHPTIRDIAWAAGVYEGEGSVSHPGYTEVTVTQKDRWILDRLKRFFGGRVYYKANHGAGKYKHHAVHRWYLYGASARGFLLTIFSFLSPWRRQQARKVLVPA